jgi:hypothetical protein
MHHLPFKIPNVHSTSSFRMLSSHFDQRISSISPVTVKASLAGWSPMAAAAAAALTRGWRTIGGRRCESLRGCSSTREEEEEEVRPPGSPPPTGARTSWSRSAAMTPDAPGHIMECLLLAAGERSDKAIVDNWERR